MQDGERGEFGVQIIGVVAEALDPPNLRGQQRQQQAVAGGAVHGLQESGAGRLDRRRPGRMIGGDDLDREIGRASCRERVLASV